MLPLPKLSALQSNLEYIKTLNHGFAIRYLQNQPNNAAKAQASALQASVTDLIANKHSDIENWSDMLKEIVRALSAGHANPYAEDVTEKLFSDISAYHDDIVKNDLSGKLNAFLTADDYKQISDPKIKDSNGDPVQKDLAYLITLVDDMAVFDQTYTLLYSNSKLDGFAEKIAEYNELEKDMLMQQKLFLITAPNGIDAEHINDEVAQMESELKKCNDEVTELAGQNQLYVEKYRTAFDKLRTATEEEKKEINKEVEFYSSEGYRSQMIEKACKVMDAERGLRQKSRERDMFNRSFDAFNGLTDMRNEIVKLNADYVDPEDVIAKRVSEMSVFFLTESEKNKAALHKNSGKFLTLQEKLKTLNSPAEFSNNPDELKKRLDTLKAAAREYIEEHSHDKIQLNAKMHNFRQNLASRIENYCEKTLKSIENITWTRSGALDQYIKHISEHPENAISSVEYAALVNPQKSIIDKTTEEIDSLKHHIESLLMTEEGMNRTGLETHSAYKASVYRSVFYLLVIDDLEKRSFENIAEGRFDIDGILSDIRKILENPDRGADKMNENPATAYLFKPFDHMESNIMHNNYDFFDEFKSTANIKAALEAHKIDTKLNEDFHVQLYIDRKILAEYLEKRRG